MACYDSKNPNCGCCPPPPPMPTCCFQGPPGVTGAVGATGATGATGMAATVQVGTTTTGAPGTNASVTNTGTESNAVLNFVIPAGATGANGADGATGADGTAATVQVGTTTTGAPGTNAIVTNTGTESNAVLNFVIPAGATGANGADGATGADGTAATVQVGTTTTGAPGTNASVTNTGTESNAVLNFVIPAGATGATGADGTAATVQVGTTTTGAPGTNASVTNTGTENNAVLNFVIPAGATGATGATGTAATVQVGTTTTGAPGTNASVTNTGTESNAVLNFVIPAGATGTDGATGATGTAATVQVGTTTTGAPGTNASVTNTGTESNAVLNFVIPAGATGASAAESRPSVLAVQDTTEQALTENTPVSFAVNLLQSGTDLTHAAGSNQITVETPGIYQAAFTAEVSPTGTATLPLTISLSLEQGTTILETSSTTMTTAEQSNTLAWNIPFTVTAAPEVLQILSDGTDVILNRATLTINKIGTV